MVKTALDPAAALHDLAQIRRRLDAALGESANARRTIQKSFQDLELTFQRVRLGQRHNGELRADHTATRGGSDLSCLTKRERAVLLLIADGNSTKQVAAQLKISFKTAVTHRTHLLQKLGVHESTSLVRIAIRNGLIAA